MVAPIIGGMTVGQMEQVKSMIRLLKQYLAETKNDRARRQIAKAVAEMAAELVEMRDAGFPFAPPPRHPAEDEPVIPQPAPDGRGQADVPPPPEPPPLRRFREGVGYLP